MSETLDDLYLEWLYAQVGSVKLKRPERTYWALIKQLYTKEFVWIVPNDHNRIEDGQALRDEFMDAQGWEEIDEDWMGLGCSMLELFLGLSRRLAFQTGHEPREWFWHLIKNLDLAKYTDAVKRTPEVIEEINDTLERIIWRTYNYDGSGGLFPLEEAPRDQRKTEIWYQLSTYLLDRV